MTIDFPADTYMHILNNNLRIDDIRTIIDFWCKNPGIVNNINGQPLNDSKTIVCVNHFSHNALATHTELEAKTEKYGFITPYDGLEIEF